MKWNTSKGNSVIELIFVIPFVLIFLWGVEYLFELGIAKQQREIAAHAQAREGFK